MTNPTVSRRVVLSGLAASTAVPAAVAAPAVLEVHPWDEARRLADELSEALAKGDGAFSGPGGKWYANIEPASSQTYKVMFGSISARSWPRENVTVGCRRAIDAYTAARETLGKASDATDAVLIGREPSTAAQRRWRNAVRAEARALLALCSFRPVGARDAKAKADQLRPLLNELQEPHLLALLGSTY